MTRRVLQAAKPDASWQEYEQLFEALVARAGGVEAVERAGTRAAVTLDRLLGHVDDEPAEAFIAFLRAFRACVRAYIAAEPALREFAYPAGRIHRESVGLYPPVISYFLSPLGSIGALGQVILRALLQQQIASGRSVAVAKAILRELERQVTFTIPVLKDPAMRRELRDSAGVKRGRGAPAGGEMPELKELLERIEKITTTAATDRDITLAWVAGKLGFGEKTLRRWLRDHYGINFRALIRARRAERALGAREKDSEMAP